MLEYEVNIEDGAEVSIEGSTIKVKGPKGELSRKFINPNIKVKKKDHVIALSSETERKKTKAIMGTWRAHLNNMVTGTTKGFECSLKLVYAHFPVKVEVNDRKLVIKNFLGGRSTRSAELLDGVELDIKGDDLTLKGIDKELVGQTAANIEHATKVKCFDKRVFQDGIHITSKPFAQAVQKGEGG